MLRIGPNAASDENSAINIIKDTQRVGIQKDPTGEYILDVSGSINCDAIFVGGNQFRGGGVWIQDTCGNISYDDGNVSISGDLSMGGNIIPTVDSTYDIGSAEYKIRHLYLSNSSLWLGDDNKLTVDSTTGSFKTRKRKTNVIPKKLLELTNPVTLSDLYTWNNSITQISDMTLKSWDKFVKESARRSEIAAAGIYNSGDLYADNDDDDFDDDDDSFVGTANRIAVTDSNGELTSSSVTTTELNFLDGVTSSIQTQLGNKQNAITAGTNLSFSGNTLNATSSAPTITASRVCVGDANGNLTASNITTTELNRLDGINFNIKSGFDNKITGGVRIDNLGFMGTTNSGNEWNIRISGGRTSSHNWSGSKASNEFGGSLALGGDFDGATIGLRVNYDIRQRHGYFQSDDRCKHLEQETENCLDKIMVLTPKTYVKSVELYDDDFILSEDGSNRKEGDNFTAECGFIAQEVLKSAEEHQYNELGFSVNGGDYTDSSGNLITAEYNLNYNNLFCLAVGAIKELKAKVEHLESKLMID